jgi:hypothetical protein
MKWLIVLLAVAAILLAGILLWAAPQGVQRKVAPVVPSTSSTQSTAVSVQPLAPSPTASLVAAATTTHNIDWVSISPSTMSSGAGTPVTITAQISDPAVIRNSINLIFVSSTGTPQIIGTLNDNGVNGDATANDNIFTIVMPFARYPSGTVDLRISAAFTGSLTRAQSGLFELNIVPPVATSTWTTLTDSQQLLSIQVPSAWNLVVSESPGDDPGTIKNVHFEFPDGTIVFTISVDSTSSLDALQNGDGPQPVFLGQSGQYVFGETDPQSVIGNESISMTEIAQTLPQIMATFTIL